MQYQELRPVYYVKAIITVSLSIAFLILYQILSQCNGSVISFLVLVPSRSCPYSFTMFITAGDDNAYTFSIIHLVISRP